MPLREAIHAVRYAVAVSRLEDVRYVRLTGPGAWDALDHLCSGELYLRDGQLLHGLLLDEEAHPFADCHVGRDDEDYVLLLEGPTASELDAHLARHLPRGEVTVEDLTADVGMLGLDGPYAWELLGLVAGAECIGLPYLTFVHLDRWTIYRAGKTGEYGYGFIVPREDLDALERRLGEVGAALDVATAGRDALDQCALENWFFNIRREGREPVTPLELQLQWRVSSRKRFVGSDALHSQRVAGIRQRLTCLVGASPSAIHDTVWLEGAPVGRVVNAGYSHVRGDWVTLALLDVAWAYPGIDFAVTASGDGASLRSMSPPVVDNRSLHVSPQRHSYASRGQYTFPVLPRTSP